MTRRSMRRTSCFSIQARVNVGCGALSASCCIPLSLAQQQTNQTNMRDPERRRNVGGKKCQKTLMEWLCEACFQEIHLSESENVTVQILTQEDSHHLQHVHKAKKAKHRSARRTQVSRTHASNYEKIRGQHQRPRSLFSCIEPACAANRPPRWNPSWSNKNPCIPAKLTAALGLQRDVYQKHRRMVAQRTRGTMSWPTTRSARG